VYLNDGDDKEDYLVTVRPPDGIIATGLYLVLATTLCVLVHLAVTVVHRNAWITTSSMCLYALDGRAWQHAVQQQALPGGCPLHGRTITLCSTRCMSC
jgi:hypothetical protein